MRLSIIVAVADNGVIGADDGLPWRLPGDLRRFKRLTLGHHLLVGRKTFESIGRALPGRRMLVLSRGEPRVTEGVRVVGSLAAGLEIAAAASDPEPFVAGGAQIYRSALPRADRIYLTRVHAEPAGEVRFPPVDWKEWRLRFRRQRQRRQGDSAPTTYEVWDRRDDG